MSKVSKIKAPKIKASTPFDDDPSFFGRLNRFMFPIAGPASIGAGHAEDPYVAPLDPACPVCGRAMAQHVIQRSGGNVATRLICPVD